MFATHNLLECLFLMPGVLNCMPVSPSAFSCQSRAGTSVPSPAPVPSAVPRNYITFQKAPMHSRTNFGDIFFF